MVDIKKNDHMHLHPTTRRCSFFFIKKAGSRGWERAGWLDHWEASFRNPSQTGGHALCLPRSCFSSVGQEAWNTVWWKSVYALALEPVPDSCCRLVLPIHATCSSRWAGRQAPPGWATGGGGLHTGHRCFKTRGSTGSPFCWTLEKLDWLDPSLPRQIWSSCSTAPLPGVLQTLELLGMEWRHVPHNVALPRLLSPDRSASPSPGGNFPT